MRREIAVITAALRAVFGQRKGKTTFKRGTGESVAMMAFVVFQKTRPQPQ